MKLNEIKLTLSNFWNPKGPICNSYAGVITRTTRQAAEPPLVTVQGCY